MDTMFTIPNNILLVVGAGIPLAVIGFVIYGFIKGWKNVNIEDVEIKDPPPEIDLSSPSKEKADRS